MFAVVLVSVNWFGVACVVRVIVLSDILLDPVVRRGLIMVAR